MTSKTYTVYILSSASRTLYIGITSDLARRLEQHQLRSANSFTCRYNIDRLVWYEELDSPWDAIAREKEIKAWRRQKKLNLIASNNPAFRDLSTLHPL
ncbi:MAG: GIY-YIG nuclease family protein [Verrucomicrobiae bacterium]|nr:GIY-YIG nuclease family protein [Verrucomicrobiae bacterium]